MDWKRIPSAATGILSLTFLVSFPSSCKNETAGRGQVETRDSTEHLQIDPLPFLTIGESDGTEAELFGRIGHAAFLSDGGIVVGDRQLALVRIFEENGALRVEAGGKGEGPGEFQTVTAVWDAGAGSVGVFDERAKRITFLDRAGEVLRTHPLTGVAVRAGLYFGRFQDGDLALGWLANPGLGGEGRGIKVDTIGVGRVDPETGSVQVLGAAPGMVRVDRLIHPFTPFPHGAVSGGEIHYTDGLDPDILVLAGPEGRARRIEVRPPDRDPSSAWGELRDALTAAGREADLHRLGGLRETDWIPAFSEMVIDAAGMIWLKEYEPSTDSNWLGGWAGVEGGLWAVVDPNGARQGMIPMPEGLIVFEIDVDRVLGFTRDSLGVERIQVHRIAR